MYSFIVQFPFWLLHIPHCFFYISGNPDLIGMSPRKLVNTKRICEDHFRKEDILPSGRLMHGAAPLQYTPTPSQPSPRVLSGQ